VTFLMTTAHIWKLIYCDWKTAILKIFNSVNVSTFYNVPLVVGKRHILSASKSVTYIRLVQLTIREDMSSRMEVSLYCKMKS